MQTLGLEGLMSGFSEKDDISGLWVEAGSKDYFIIDESFFNLSVLDSDSNFFPGMAIHVINIFYVTVIRVT